MDLWVVNVNLVDMVVFLLFFMVRKIDDLKLVDKELILVLLNLKVMLFDDVVGMLSESIRNVFVGLEFYEVL